MVPNSNIYFRQQTLSSWTSSGERCDRANSLPADVPVSKVEEGRMRPQSKDNSSVSPTTSDEENKNHRHHRAPSSTTANNSTMESLPGGRREGEERDAREGSVPGRGVAGGNASNPTTIDRAKSFEYFPGESFQAQLQENSSR